MDTDSELANSVPEILYEDSNLIVINKLAGMHSVSLPGELSESVAQWLRSKFPEVSNASQKDEDGGLINRLDFHTSGVLIAARSRPVWEKLYTMLRSGLIKKSYHALVEGRFPDSKTVEAPIGARSRSAAKVKVYGSKVRSKDRALPAVSRFSLIRYSPGRDASLIEAHIDTGRRHQIRAHCAFAGYPLLGDLQYGSKRKLSEFDQAGGPEFNLHARSVNFHHPISSKQIEIVANYPPLFAHIAALI